MILLEMFRRLVAKNLTRVIDFSEFKIHLMKATMPISTLHPHPHLIHLVRQVMLFFVRFGYSFVAAVATT